MSVRVGIVGCGWWATHAHLPAVQAHADAELVALADSSAAGLEAAGERFGVGALFPDPEQLLHGAEVDAVVVAAPNALHYPVARLALERGKHVLLEKPMVIEPTHGRELIELARRNAVELVIGYPMHYNPQVRVLRREIAAGRIGPVEHVACLYASIVRELYAGNPERYRDVVFDYPVNAPAVATYNDPAVAGGGQGQSQLSHAAALLLWLTALEPLQVAAFTSSFGLPVDIADTLAVRFRGDAIGTLSSTGAVTPGHPEIVRYDIFGREGHVVFDVNEGIAEIHDARGVERLAQPEPAERYPERAPVGNLVDLALGRGQNESPPEIGLRTAELVSAMYRSAEGGRLALTDEV